jgi:AcrR family transcriptional regulator
MYYNIFELLKAINNIYTFVGILKEEIMNKLNNRKRKASQEKIEKVFVQLIQNKEINEISVTDICKKANLNRSTFYANYIDVYDLADKIREKLEIEVKDVYKEERDTGVNSNDFLKLFRYIKENQIFFKTFFKLNLDNKNTLFEYDYNLAKEIYNNQFIDYHITFFMSGLNAVIKKWLENDCQETPEEISQIIKDEYMKKDIFLNKN